MKVGKRALSLVMCLAMALALLPTAAFAAEKQGGDVQTQAGSEEDGMGLNKTIQLEDDGTYTINLEAFATGETVTTVSTNPTDVVLVLDVSGSMDEDFTYVTGQDWQFTDQRVRDTPTNVYHKCPDGTYSTITWTETGWNGIGTYRYVCDHCHATRKWGTPGLAKIPGEGDDDPWNLYEYSDVSKTEQKMAALKEAVKAFLDGVEEKNEALTDPDQQHRVSIVKFASEDVKDTVGNDKDWNGYNYTQTVQNLTTVTADNVQSLKNTVDSLTTGGATAADKGLQLAKNQLADSSDREKVVILFTDGQPTYGSSFQTAVANNAISTAKQLKDNGTTIYTIGTFADDDVTTNLTNYMNGVSSNYPNAQSLSNLGAGSDQGYYKRVGGQLNLTDIFTEISQDIGTTTVTLNADAVTKDLLTDAFTFASDAQVTVQTDEYKGRDNHGYRVFYNTPSTLDGAICTIDRENGTVSVSGFDFAANCLVDGSNPDEEDFTSAVQGKKLMITIRGVVPTDEAITNDLVYTNKASSGVYENASATGPTAVFNRPQTKLTSAAYVLDYAKTATLNQADWQANSVASLESAMQKIASQSQLTLAHGKVSKAGDITYTPTTMQWDGADDFYSFGKSTSDANQWSKVTVVPASSVYYEDDFVTDASTGTVGIEYTGDWTIDGTSDGNTEDVNGAVQGWIEDLNDDANYSDGTAHEVTVADGNTAKATFTFTGTGVDIYSRTNLTTGTIVATLNGADDSGVQQSKFLIVDTLSDSGDYYQIPTASFSGLEHGTYTVTLSVTTAAKDRATYYLDGIRVYNPLSDETASNVKDETGIDVSAIFTSVRDMLLDAGTLTADSEVANGVVFIDQMPIETNGNSGTTSEIGTYEEYGPKNEVYLAQGQAIAFAVGDLDATYYVGLKAPAGQTTAVVTNGTNDNNAEISVNAASDLYYEIQPNAEGIIMIKNNGTNLLSVTKLCMTGVEGPVEEISFQAAPAMLLSYADTFQTMETVPYTLNGINEEEFVEEEEPSEPDDSQNDESNDGNVDIENPDDYEDEEDDQKKPGSALAQIIENLFSSISRWFN